jgi:hypothetical protein
MNTVRYCRVYSCRIFCRHASSSRHMQVLQNATQISDPKRIRNVGIIAHIDAGR